jgi:hypothetical protein
LVVLFKIAEVLSCQVLGNFSGDGLVMVYVRPDRIWISRGVEIFEKTDVIAYHEIAWVKDESTPRGERRLRIVYGSNLETTFVTWLEAADFEVLLALLKERCPAAFTPDPPVGYVPSPYPHGKPPQDRLTIETSSALVFPFGPKIYRRLAVSTLLTLVSLALAALFCGVAMIGGSQGALSVPGGSCALFIGFGFLFLVHQCHWMRLLGAALRGERRSELHLTAQGIMGVSGRQGRLRTGVVVWWRLLRVRQNQASLKNSHTRAARVADSRVTQNAAARYYGLSPMRTLS